MVLMQQGSQIAQIFGPGAGVSGILRGVWQGLMSLVSPTLAVVGGIAAIGAAAAATVPARRRWSPPCSLRASWHVSP